MTRFMVMAPLFMVLAGCAAFTPKKPLVDVSLLRADEMTALKNEVKGDLSAVRGDLSAMKGNIGEIAAVKGDVSALKGSIENLSAQLSAQGQAVAGFNNRLEATTAGRDITTSTNNDTELMRYIVGVLAGLCSTLIGLLGWCLKTLLRRDKEKDFYKKMVFTKVAHDEDDVFKIRQAHDQFVKGKKEAV